MFSTLINRLGDWNPQLMRELRGRLQLRNGCLVVATSLMIQALILLSFSSQNCTSYVNNRCVEFVWEFDWLMIFRTLNWILPLSLFSIGVYLLVSDWMQEQRRGTLNFIRLTPQSSQRVLWGKILGVPILVYLALSLAIPLHLGAGIAAGVPLGWIISFYALISVTCGLFYSVGLLNASLTQASYQGLAASLVGAWLGSSFLGVLDWHFDWQNLIYRDLGNWSWFLWNLGETPLQLKLWMLITISVSAYWVWQATNRMFRNPNGTLLSKQQSYGLVGSVQVWLLGLFWSLPRQFLTSQDALFGCLFGISLFSLVVLLAVSFAISPQRQSLLDWSRYGQFQRQNSTVKNVQMSWREWLWGEKSPSSVAIAVNLAITAIVWFPWLLRFPVGVDDKVKAIAGLLLCANLIGFYALLIQLMLIIRRKKPWIWAGSTLSMTIFVPLFILSVIQVDSTSGVQLPGLWLVSVFGAPWIILEQTSVFTVLFSLLGQWVIMAGLIVQLTRQLKRIGESASKPLFANPNALPNSAKAH
ncbi:MAG: hypothetical protein RID53_28580 [Coleofasciculus sp. B1-GNL1-01]|uniref:hypothetical protein n=1 Tax=Coleofasciculus sp. B1-GNL1-01 TaxID=3068484 RepID=UPI0033027E04